MARDGLLRQTACKPGSVLRLTANGWPFLWDDGCPSPHATYPDGYPETDYVPSLFGLAPGGACRAAPVARIAVRSYRTISTSPPVPQKGATDRRYVFCGAIPGVAPGGCYPSPCFRGARTFLPKTRFVPSQASLVQHSHAIERPSGHLTRALYIVGVRPKPADQTCAIRAKDGIQVDNFFATATRLISSR